MKQKKIMMLTLVFCMLLTSPSQAEATTVKETSVLNYERTEVCNAGALEIPTSSSAAMGKMNSMTEFLKKQTEVSVKTTVVSKQILRGLENEVIRQVNAERAKYGLHPLSVSARLNSAALVRAQEIVAKFSHTRPDGSSWSTVSSEAFGENIAKGHSSANRVMAAWMTSQGHRANILRERFGSIGVCALKVNGITYWVQLFGR